MQEPHNPRCCLTLLSVTCFAQLATLDAVVQAFVQVRTNPKWLPAMRPLALFQRRLQQSMFPHTHGAVLPCFKSIYEQQREECVVDMVELSHRRKQLEYRMRLVEDEMRARVREFEQTVEHKFR